MKFRLNHRSKRAAALARYLKQHLDPESLPPDLCLVLGGDGTMMRAIRDMGANWTYLGINCGRVGFLMNDVEDEARFCQEVAARRYQVHSLPRLGLEAWVTKDEEEPSSGEQEGRVSAYAINDVFVERMTAQSCHLRVTINDASVVDRLVCDGLIVATALGSTAYSVSAGGPACHALLQTMHITPICPFSPRLIPIVLPLSSRVAVEPIDSQRRPIRAVADGVGYPRVRRLRIRNSGSDVRLAYLQGHEFTATLFRKVLLS